MTGRPCCELGSVPNRLGRPTGSRPKSMLLADLLKMSWRQIVRNKRRYRGAILGTALGIAGLITVLTIGESVENSLGLNLEILGNATVIKATWDGSRALTWHRGEFYERDVETLKDLPNVMAVAPIVWRPKAKITHGRNNATAKVIGVDPSFFRAFHLPLASGRAIGEDDVRDLRHVCIIGEEVREKLFASGVSPLGKEVICLGHSFEVVGVLGGGEDPELLKTIFVPISLARAKLEDMSRIQDIYVRADNWDMVPQLYNRVRSRLEANQPAYADSMQFIYYGERIAAIQRIAFVFKFFLCVAVVVTLILGGLGIANVMLSTVKERTMEIGLRKAVGATERMIVSQFLFESLTVSLLGAAIGIVSGTIAVEILKNILSIPAAKGVFVLSILISVIIGVLLGVVSGVVPAGAAGKMDPVEAMRFE